MDRNGAHGKRIDKDQVQKTYEGTDGTVGAVSKLGRRYKDVGNRDADGSTALVQPNKSVREGACQVRRSHGLR
jgi:hypothetical protein